jgi:uncharacterized glyoxalase superfamily protein PhnB
MNRSAPPGPIVPSLIYEDVGAAIDWLCRTFGFTERLRAPGPDGHLIHAQLLVGQGAILLGARRLEPAVTIPATIEFRPPRPNEVSHTLSVPVEDVDGHFERSVRHGARILVPPTDLPFGERQYTALDLDGHRWTFSETIADVAPAEWGAIRSG